MSMLFMETGALIIPSYHYHLSGQFFGQFFNSKLPPESWKELIFSMSGWAAERNGNFFPLWPGVLLLCTGVPYSNLANLWGNITFGQGNEM